MPVCDDYPEIECPKCKATSRDLDGFGFVFCEACGHCVHNSQSGRDGYWHCNACGRRLNPLDGPAHPATAPEAA